MPRISAVLSDNDKETSQPSRQGLASGASVLVDEAHNGGYDQRAAS